MKRLAIVLLFVWCDFAFGQTAFVPVTITFPQIAAGGDAGGVNYVTILQIVNSNSAPITGHVSLFADNGSPLAVLFDGQGPKSTLDIGLAAGQGREIQITLNGPVTPGWMQIAYTPSDALTTVILQFRSGATLVSEVGVQPIDLDFRMSATDFVAETNPTLNTGIAIANPDTLPAYVLASLWDPNTGTITSQNTLSLPPNGHISRFVTDIFPSVAQTRAKVSLDQCSDASCSAGGGNGFLATAMRFTGDFFTTIPATQRSDDGEQIRILPQVAFGGPSDALNMKTVLYLTTNVPSGVFATAEIFDDDGNPLPASADGAAPTSSLTLTVPGNRVTRVVLSGDQTLRSGWMRLTLPGTLHLITNAVFQTFIGASAVSEASVLESPPAQQGLVYVGTRSGAANVGVALANPQTTPSTVTLRLFDQSGALSAAQDVTLPPSGHLARFVTELFPDFGSINDFNGSLAVSSGAAVSALALRLTSDKIATLPVASNGMYRPAITAIRAPRVQRSPAQVNFELDVTDNDTDVATSSSSSVSAMAYIDFGSTSDNGSLSIDGTKLINQRSGTLAGTFKLPDIASVPSGTPAILYMWIFDSAGNQSNYVRIQIRF